MAKHWLFRAARWGGRGAAAAAGATAGSMWMSGSTSASGFVSGRDWSDLSRRGHAPVYSADAFDRQTVGRVGDKVALSDQGYMGVLAEDGYVQPPHITKEATDGLGSRFRLRDSDIVIATYPKCGTTWMQQIVMLLLAAGDKEKVPDALLQAVWLESAASMGLQGVESKSLAFEKPLVFTPESLNDWDAPLNWTGPGMPHRRVFKTHAPCSDGLLPWKGGRSGIPEAGKVIVVTRGPRDQAVSMWHHSKDVPAFEYSSDFEHFLKKLWMQGRVESGDFYKWHATWWHAPLSMSQRLWVRYEDLQEDLPGGVRRIAAFLDLPVTDEVIDKVVKGSTFSSMKQQTIDADKKKEERGIFVKKDHIRQGKSGKWMKTFGPELAVMFDGAHAKAMGEVSLSEAAVANS
eukprot:TRINITY_DN8007_c0_g1_i1.p1 TRINITY_DN8007_c0_g1~~TRINITY_DN8007_c0_g1_i1.p1  ORF type:complete len:403 (+),score=79.02 TRINITY_DN8007_c0_g1_i1:65-1273(+)